MENTNILLQTLSPFLAFIPKLVGVVFILIIGLNLAKLLRRLMSKMLAKTGIDEQAKKLEELDIIQDLNLKIKPSSFLPSIIFYIIVLVLCIVLTDILGLAIISNQFAKIFDYVPKIISAAVLFLAGAMLASLVRNGIFTATKSLNIPTGPIIGNVVYYFILIAFALSALEQAEVQTDFIKSSLNIILMGVVFAFALGYGFASKEIMASQLAGFYGKKKFNVGDDIQIGDLRGIITEIDAISISLQKDGVKTILPLNTLSSKEVKIFEKQA
jgi:hypothetical protein